MNIRTKALAALALLGIGSSALGYQWGFTNITNKVLLIKMTLTGTSDQFFAIAQPGRRVEFDWGMPNIRAGYCLSTIGIAEYNPKISGELPKKRTSSLIIGAVTGVHTYADYYNDLAIEKMIDNRNSPFFKSLGNHSFTDPRVNFIKGSAWGDFDEATNEAVKQITDAVGKTAEEALKFVDESGLAGKVVNWVVSFIPSIVNMAKSGKCISRNFDIIKIKAADGKKELQLFTKL